MRRVMVQLVRSDGNYYMIEGSSKIFSEESVLRMLSENKVTCKLHSNGDIDTDGMMVLKDSEPDIVTDIPDNIDFSKVNICKKLRRLAKLDRITLDTDEHTRNGGRSIHLLKYLEYCGVSPENFVKGYISNLQPYMIERLQSEEYSKNIICVLDTVYKVSMYIKVDSTQFKEVIVSFHESNKRGIAKTNNLISKSSLEDIVFVFADSVTSRSGDKYSINIIMQRGIKILPITIVGKKCKDGFLVRRIDIENFFLDYCNDYISDLYTSNLNLDFSKISVFSVLQQISFTSYGNDTFSSISLLVDSLTSQKDAISKQVASFALDEFITRLNLTLEQRLELIGLLEERYRVSSIRGMPVILNHMVDLIGCENNV